MPKCSKCMAEYNEDDIFCPNCKNPILSNSVIKIEANEIENEKIENGTYLEPPKKFNIKLFGALTVISIVIILAIIAFIVSIVPSETFQLTNNPINFGDTIFYYTNENTMGNGKIIRKNLSTNEEMTSIRYDKLSGFTVIKNKIYFIDGNILYSTDLEFKNKIKLISNVSCAVIKEKKIYYISSINKNQLRVTDLKGKNDKQLTLINVDSGENVSEITIFNKEIYAVIGNNLIKLDMAASYQKTIIKDNKINNIETQRNEIQVYLDNSIYRITNKTKTVDISSVFGSYYNNNFYCFEYSSQNEFLLNKINLKGDKKTTIYIFENIENLNYSITEMTINSKGIYFYITITSSDNMSINIKLCKISLNGKDYEEIIDIGFWTLSQ